MNKKIVVWICLMIWLVTLTAAAETVRGNLEERFGARPEITHDGKVYRLRNRLTTVLVAGIDRSTGVQGSSAGRLMLQEHMVNAWNGGREQRLSCHKGPATSRGFLK